MIRFIIAYVKSMRLYLAFVTGITGWIGVAYYEYLASNPTRGTVEVLPSLEKKIVILILLFSSWGVGQIINDFMGLEEDRVNAKKRPMVTGELNPKIAVSLSILFMAGAALITFFYLQPVAVIFLIIGFFFNLLYEFAKGHGYIGNVIYALAITIIAPYAFFASGPTRISLLTANHISLLVIILLMHINMCFFSYFKDYEGDKKAGKITMIVKYGRKRASIIGIFFSFLPTSAFLLFWSTGLLTFEINNTFIALGLLVTFFQVWTGITFYLHPEDEKNFTAMEIATKAVTCGQAALIAFFNPVLSLWLFLITFIFVGFLFQQLENSEK